MKVEVYKCVHCHWMHPCYGVATDSWLLIQPYNWAGVDM